MKHNSKPMLFSFWPHGNDPCPSEVCTPSPLLQHPSSRVHVQLQHVEHPRVPLCASDELLQVDMTCETISIVWINVIHLKKKIFPLLKCCCCITCRNCCSPSPSLSTARSIRSATSSAESCGSHMSVFMPFFIR